MKRNFYTRVFHLLLAFIIIATIPISILPNTARAATDLNTNVIFEAEDGYISQTGAMAVYTDDTAASGAYLAYKGTTSPAPTPASTDAADVTYQSAIPTAGTYAIWIRVKAVNGGSDSCYFAIGSGNYQYVAPAATNANYQWIKVTSTSLSAQTYNFRFKYREANFRLDRLIVTNNQAYIPNGMGLDVEDTLVNTNVIFEAENGFVSQTGAMTLYTDDTDASSAYLAYKGTTSPAPAPASTDAADVTYQSTIPAAGTYAIWIRVKAINGASDSCYFAIGSGNYQYVAPAATNANYQWIKVTSTSLNAQTYNFRFKYREADFRLDRLIVTDNLAYIPNGIGLDVEDAIVNTDVIFEAENGFISQTGAMALYTDDTDASGAYLAYKGTTSPAPTPASTDAADVTYEVSIPSMDTHAIWVRIKSVNGASDSCFFALNNGEYQYFAPTSTNTDYQWVKIVSTTLYGQTYHLKFKYREANFRLDRLIVTNNLFYIPTGLGVNVADATIIEPTYTNPYNTPSIVPPANTHPRLLVRSSDLPQIRANLNDSLMADIWDDVETTASQTVSGNLPVPLPGQSNYDDNIRKVIDANALIYLIDGTTSAGNKAVSLMCDFLNTARIGKIGQYTRNMGQTIFSAALVYDWCYDLMSANQRLYFRLNMNRIAQDMECGYPPTAQGAVVGHGTEAQIQRDILSFGIAAYDENPNIYNIAAGRILDEFVPARDFVYDAGMYHQGDSYGPYRLSWDLWGQWIFNRMGAGNLYPTTQSQMPYYQIYTRRPDGQVMRNGDSFQSVYVPLGSYWKSSTAMFLAANYYNDGYIKDEFLHEYSSGDTGDPVMMVLFNNPNLTATSVSSLPLSKYFGSPKGYMVARTGWGSDTGSVVATMNIGGYSFNNHQHLDAGSFQLYYKGALAIDSGIYEGGLGGYYGDDHDVNYNKRTIAHNSMLVNDPNEQFLWYSRTTTNQGGAVANDGGQKFPNNFAEPETLEDLLDEDNGYETSEVLKHSIGMSSTDPDFSYIKGNLTNAYTSKVSDYKRSMVFLNMKDETYPGVLIVHDNITSSNASFKKTWLLHSISEPAISGNTQTITNTSNGNNGKLVNTTLLPGSITTTKIGGSGYEFYVNGTNYSEAANSYSCDESGHWRIEISPGTSAGTDEFLNVMQVMDSTGGPTPLAVSSITGSIAVGAKISDRVVVFGKNSNEITTNTSFTIPGSDTDLYILVTDLQAGYWTVAKTGETPVYQHLVNNEAGVLYFKGSAGTYNLTYSTTQTLPLAPAYEDQ